MTTLKYLKKKKDTLNLFYGIKNDSVKNHSLLLVPCSLVQPVAYYLERRWALSNNPNSLVDAMKGKSQYVTQMT